MSSDQYIRLIRSGGFLISWIILWATFPAHRRAIDHLRRMKSAKDF